MQALADYPNDEDTLGNKKKNGRKFLSASI